jgi:hypothetical protein
MSYPEQIHIEHHLGIEEINKRIKTLEFPFRTPTKIANNYGN